MDNKFIQLISEFLTEEEKLVFVEAIQRFLSKVPHRVVSKLEERLEFPPNRLHESLKVVRDEHCIFRLLALMVFESQDYYPLMRKLLSMQMNAFSDYYKDSEFKTVDEWAEYDEKIRTGDPCCYKCLQICADLFQVQIRIINGDSTMAITELVGNSPGTLANLDLDEEHLKPRTFWINYCSAQILTPTVPLFGSHQKIGSLLQIHKKIADLSSLTENQEMEVSARQMEVVRLCQSFFEDQDRPVSLCEVQRLHSRIHEMGFEMVDVLGDGNCLFRALSSQFFYDEKYHPLVKKLIIGKFLLDPKSVQYKGINPMQKREGPSREHCPYESRETWEQYVLRMSKDYEGGDERCLQAACDIFSTKLIRLHSHPELVMSEKFPEGEEYHGTIFCCQTSCHVACIKRDDGGSSLENS